MATNYEVDATRDKARTSLQTGIYVRAKLGSQWGFFDIGTLELPSLREWLRSRGGANDWAEQCVAMLLGHDPAEIAKVWPQPQREMNHGKET